MVAEPIAVIGLDAKYPCDGDTPEQFFEFLVAGRSARRPVPKDKYNADAFWHPDNHRDGVIGGKEGHFLNGNIKAFDAPFFSITPAEATAMDPQQRMLLECVYTAMESAGITMDAAQGQSIGTYLGSFFWDYRDLNVKDTEKPMIFTGSGTIFSTLAGRVNWFYDFRGPAVSMDTACSSSMVAFHQAVVGLKQRDCDVAMACGVNLILSPENGIQLNSLGVLNRDSTSFSFDERACGYGRGEGVGVVVLKRLADALRDGDIIRAVIRNTGSNHDGHGAGLTAPCLQAQVELMEKTYAQAEVNPAETRFFEAHGTGTLAGDPVEAGAIARMFSKHRSAEEPLWIGALKSNVGHSEGASGVSSVIKSVLALENGIIPANAWFERRNPKIAEDWHFAFPTKAMAWPETESGVRRVSINSFGISGTNAHVIIEDAFHYLKERGLTAPHRTVETTRLGCLEAKPDVGALTTCGGKQLFVFSSHDMDGISRLAKSYHSYLPRMAEPLENLSYTLAAKRSQFGWRAAVVAGSVDELQSELAEDKKLTATRTAANVGLAFVFTGQGAQWAGMGMQLMPYYSVFRESLEAADAYLREELGCEWSVVAELQKPADQSRINEAEFSQPLCTALQVALVDLLTSWGITPRAVTGHSSGEMAAAYACGAISRESAWKVSYWRGFYSAKLRRTQTQQEKPTTMAAVGLDLDKANEAIDRVHAASAGAADKLTVACMNSRTSHTISGDRAQIEALVEMLRGEGVFARKLAVEMAYHSPHMEPMSEEYAKAMGEIEPGVWKGAEETRPLFFSSTFGSLIPVDKVRDTGYWTKNLISPVRFNESVGAMLSLQVGDNGYHLVSDLLEVGPHSALRGPLREIVDDVRGDANSANTAKYHAVLQRTADDLQAALEAAGRLFTRGVPLDLVKVNSNDALVQKDQKPELMINLPRYPFNHSKEYWCEDRLARNFRLRAYPRHELLGAPVNDWDGAHDAVWRNWIRVSENPWVEHHVVSGAILYPAAGMLVMAIEASRQLAERAGSGKDIRGFRFREVSFHAALRVADDATGTESHVYVRPVRQAARESKASEWLEFQVCTAQQDDSWREHCRGQILVEYEAADSANAVDVDSGREDGLLKKKCSDSIDAARQTCSLEVESEKLYEAFGNVGLDFGTTFQTVCEVRVDPTHRKALATVTSTVPKLRKLMPYEYLQPHVIHPTTLDGTLQTAMSPIFSDPSRRSKKAVVPTFVDELWVAAAGHGDDGYLVCADVEPCGRKDYETRCMAVDPATWQPRVLFKGLIVTEVDGSDAHGGAEVASEDDPKHRAWHSNEWKVDPELLSLEESKKTFGVEGGFAKYMDALAHKNPLLKMLELDVGGTGGSNDVLSTLGSRYAYVQHDVMDVEGLGDNNSAAESSKSASYNVVVGTGLSSLTDAALAGVLRLLKAGGKFVLALSQRAGGSDIWGRHLASRGFSHLSAEFQDADLTIMVFDAPSAARVAEETASSTPAPGDFYLVLDPASTLQQGVADKLSSVLTSQSQSIIRTSIQDFLKDSAKASPARHANSTCILLHELDSGLLTRVDEHILQTLKSVVDVGRLIWVNKGACPETELVPGFATCVRLEKKSLDFVILTVQPGHNADMIADKIMTVDGAITKGNKNKDTETDPDLEPGPEVAYQLDNGILQVERITEAKNLSTHINQHTQATLPLSNVGFGADPTRSLRLRIRDIGLLDTLYFDDDEWHAAPLGGTEIEFQAAATAVNFKDLAIMLGKISESQVGLEAAGFVTRVGPDVTRFKPGDRVFGYAHEGAFSTHVRSTEGTTALLPEGVDFAEAAAIPIVYTTAYGCLYDIGDLEKRVTRARRGGKTKVTVLIHAAASGVGQAAIQFAQQEGAEVFATVGSREKRDFLEQTYGIPHDHIFSSRNATFKEGVMRVTAGRGVDIIINCLAGDLLRASWECVAPFGAFAEIGVSDIEARSRISMNSFARSVRFESFELRYMRQTDLPRIEDLFQRTVAHVFDGGKGLRRLTPITKFTTSEIQSALRLMQSGKHIGKLVVKHRDDDVVPVVSAPQPACRFHSDATYLISGGLGGLGREIIRWMVSHGARNLIVTSRRGGASGKAAEELIGELQAKGVKIATPACDITDKKSVEEAISSSLAFMPPIMGCIQASMVLCDNGFSLMTLPQWEFSLNVKVHGTRNLWETLMAQQQQNSNSNNTLDFFVMLSSMASTLGNPGQANYSAGNSYQDALGRHLASTLTGSMSKCNVTTLNVPLMTDAGVIVGNDPLMDYFYSIGWSHMKAPELIAALDYHCRPLDNSTTEHDKDALDAHVLPRLWLPRYTAAAHSTPLAWQYEARFSHLIVPGYTGDGDANGSGNSNTNKNTAGALLGAAETMAEAETVALELLLGKLTKVLSIDAAELDAGRPTTAYGVDSLVAVELHTWIVKEMGADLSVFDITSGQSIARLAAKAAGLSRFVRVGEEEK